MKARKKPIEVLAYHYNHNIILDEFLNLLKSNENEPVHYNELDGTIYIQKERGLISIPKGNWVISEINTDNCFWSIDPQIFLKTYERVPNTLYTFKKKVYEVDCIELKSLEEDNIKEILEFIDYKQDNDSNIKEFVENCKIIGYIPIKTLEGIEALYPTEILIKGVEGEFYPVSKINFNKVYEIIENN